MTSSSASLPRVALVTASRARRDPIEVAADQRTDGIDFKSEPGVTIVVTATTANGEAPAHFGVTATREGDEAEHYAASGRNHDPAQLEALPPGRYHLEAQHFMLSDETTVEIAGRETKRVALELRERR